MSNEEKQLLLIDLCARLPYRVIVRYKSSDTKEAFNQILDYTMANMVEYIPHIGGIEIKPYLRPLSSMTKEEEEEYNNCYQSDDTTTAMKLIDFYNTYHFDYRGLIPMGLALEAPEGMYNF